MRSTLLIALLVAPRLCAGESSVVLQTGDKVPEFQAVDDTGKVWKSSEHVGRNIIVVYFYPADMTRDCTRQACGFQKHLDEIQRAGVQVVGISGDNSRNHQLFKKMHSLKFPLLSDVDGKVANTFGVPTRSGGQITRLVDGQPEVLSRGVTAQRWTFVIGRDGTIIHRNTKVTASTDCESVLKVVRRLTASTR